MISEKFLSKFIVNDDTGCWEWKGAGGKRYGLFWHNKKQTRAHRYSFELYKGKIPEGMHVCHKCDNPRCVNPDHLWLGTHTENMEDKMKKGRCAGERSGKNKVTEKQVLSIRKEYEVFGDKVEVKKRLSKKYGISRSTIGDIVKRRNWRHI